MILQSDIQNKLQGILPRVTKPGRYVGNELYSVHKIWQKAAVRFALAFPDLYELGMSHLGTSILYHRLNDQPWILAERVFAPWVDLEKQMRSNQIPLFSLESMRPIRQFDVLGFTLQYELQYTNVLNMLDLSGIPVRSADRTEEDPLILAGGPCAYNPEPLAEFLDAVLLGDGEEAVIEVASVVRDGRLKQWKRSELLKQLSQIDGIYVPSLYESKSQDQSSLQRAVPKDAETPSSVTGRSLESFSLDYFPQKPIVPFIVVAHDRLSLEVMRGCTRGCRFCNAGMIYRPQRFHPVQDLVKYTAKVLENTGYDEVSLVSLSTSDYPELPQLIQSLRPVMEKHHVSLSFPSLRAETFTPEMAEMAQGLKTSGLTIAPEAGTQRLRDAINKNITEKDILNAVETAFQSGWRRIKLYFMIGLPTETQGDIQGIVDLIHAIVRIAKKSGRKEINVSISPFSPKAFTPFQWDAQDTPDVLQKKIDFLKANIKWREVKLAWRDPFVSQLETVFGRGDRRLGQTLYTAWKSGARFDGWTEEFKATVWRRAFESSGIDLSAYTASIPHDAALPWDHLNKGVAKEFLLKERNKADTGQLTADCFSQGCQACGLQKEGPCSKTPHVYQPGKKGAQIKPEQEPRKKRMIEHPTFTRKIRLQYEKNGEVRFISHLDTIRMFSRALRRAKIPVVYSQGFHPHPKIASGPPLAVGYTSEAEFMDIEILQQIPKDFKERLNAQVPKGFQIIHAFPIMNKLPSLSSAITLNQYRVTWEGAPATEDLKEEISRFLHSNSCLIKRRDKQVDIRMFVVGIQIIQNGFDLTVKLNPNGTARVDEVFQAILGPADELPDIMHVHRVGQFIEERGRLNSPLDNL